jgi:hypothetical protein
MRPSLSVVIYGWRSRRKRRKRMANHLIEFSEQIEDITPDEWAWLTSLPAAGQYELDDEAFIKALTKHGIDVKAVQKDDSLNVFPDFESHLDAGRKDWWVSTHNSDSGTPAHVALVVQAFIKKFRINYVFTLTWSEGCSKPRIGEFGGGWLVVSRLGITYGSTWDSAELEAGVMRIRLKKKG